MNFVKVTSGGSAYWVNLGNVLHIAAAGSGSLIVFNASGGERPVSISVDEAPAQILAGVEV